MGAQSVSNSIASKEASLPASKHTSRVNSSQHSQMRRMVQTAAEHFSHRGSRVRNNRPTQHSRISTAGEAHGKIQKGLDDESVTGLGHHTNSLAIHITANEDPVSSVASPKHTEEVSGNVKPILPSLNGISYPVAPDQPMLTDRYSQRPDARKETEHSNNLPNSLQQSPERDEILLFAPLKTSAVKQRTFVQSSDQYYGIGDGSVESSHFISSHPGKDKPYSTRFNKRSQSKKRSRQSSRSPIHSRDHADEVLRRSRLSPNNGSCMSNGKGRHSKHHTLGEHTITTTPKAVGLDKKFSQTKGNRAYNDSQTRDRTGKLGHVASV